MIKEDLYNEIKNDVNISAITGSRVFFGSPIKEQKNPYITFRLDPEEEYNDVRNKAMFRIFCFRKDTKEVDELAALVKTLLEGSVTLNGNKYYLIHVISQRDGNVRLKNGFYYATLRVEIQYTP